MARLAPVRPAPGYPARPLRITRRGRLLFLCSVVMTMFAALSLGKVATEAATHLQRAPRLAHVVVRPGETLWQVAVAANPGTDPRVEVAQLVALNRLETGEIYPGEVLLLPPQ